MLMFKTTSLFSSIGLVHWVDTNGFVQYLIWPDANAQMPIGENCSGAFFFFWCCYVLAIAVDTNGFLDPRLAMYITFFQLNA